MVITNEASLIDTINYRAPLGNSDHLVLEIMTVSSPLETDNVRVLPDMRKSNFEKIKVLNIDWESLLVQRSTTTEDLWNAFLCKYLQ